MSLAKEWAVECRHPSATALLSLPNAIYFLLKFRPDLASFEDKTVEGRLELYLWWKAYGERDYPDFEWTLRDTDIAWLRSLTVETLISAFPRAVSFWLAGDAPSIFDEQTLFDALFENGIVIKPTRAHLPRFLPLLVRARADLAVHIDLQTFSGQLAALTWWETHGQFEYPRLQWSPDPVWEKLNELGVEQGTELIAVPAFLQLLVHSRADLQTSIDLTKFHDRLSALLWWDQNGRFEYPKLVWHTAPVFRRLNELERSENGSPIAMPRFLVPLVESRPDLSQDPRSRLDMKTFGGQLGALLWWDKNGKFEYPHLVWQTAPVVRALNTTERDSSDTLIDLPLFLAPLVQSRPDLRAAFDLSTFEGRLNVLRWWEAHSRREYPQLRWATAKVFERLNELDDGDQRELFRAPNFLPRLVAGRPDLASLFNLETFDGRFDALYWWNQHGQREYPILEWRLHETFESLIEPRPTPAGLTLPAFLLSIRARRPDLVAAFDVATAQGVHTLIAWWNQDGRHEYPLLQPLAVTMPAHAERAVTTVENGPPEVLNRPFGVNIVGFPQGVLGLGEDARMAAQAMQLGGFEVALVNAPMSGPPLVDTSMNHLLRDDLKYQISLFCLPPPEMVRLTLEGGRHMVDSNTYRIGAWPWELPHWPSAFGRANEFVDEIWAQSRFVETVYARLGTSVVRRMPMGVAIPEPRNTDRRRFGLPEHDFLFYVMFDGNSWLTRKNPVAGVMAFKQAFADEKSGVGLVIKAMNIRNDDPTWRQVLDLAENDARIHILSERLDRQDTIDFMACCDAYISLHRSEGFGRVIAEAMLLGQPVIVTNFSGNVDFCDTETAFLVDGDLVPLRPGEYLFHEGQYWCAPDVGVAAEQIRRALEDKPQRDRIAQAGKMRIQRDYSIEAVSRAYSQRLAELSEGVLSK